MFVARSRNVTRRGRAHTQRCEDESLVFSYNQIAVIIAFDGCSSGKDSYFASGLFAKLFKKIAIQHKTYLENLDENSNLRHVTYNLMELFFNELKYSFSYFVLDLSEILSTIVLSVVNIKTKQSYSVIVGDGSIYIDGIIHSINAEENAPYYISYFLSTPFADVWEYNINKYSFKVERVIAVLSDGIDSFKNYNENRYVTEAEKKDIIARFLESNYLLNNKIGLARICNMLETESNIAPSDDLSIAHITFVENETI